MLPPTPGSPDRWVRERNRYGNNLVSRRGLAVRGFGPSAAMPVLQNGRASNRDDACVQVKGASLENGLLHVDLVREIPEAMKPRAIPIASSGKLLEVKSAKVAA